MWVVFALGSAFFAGITAVIAKIGIKKVDSDVATAVRTIIILIFSWLMVFIAGTQNEIANISFKTLFFLILSGAATGGSWLCYFKALQLGNVNKVAPIDKSSTVLTIILAFIILRESITITKFIAIILIGLGTYLMISRRDLQSDETKTQTWIIYAILSAVFASLTSILGKIGMRDIDSNLGTAIRTIVVLIMAWIVILVLRKTPKVKEIDRKSLSFICFSGITTGFSWLCYYKALQEGQASIVVPIDKLSIVITIIFSYFFLNEKLSGKAFTGLLLLVSGTLTLLL